MPPGIRPGASPRARGRGRRDPRSIRARRARGDHGGRGSAPPHELKLAPVEVLSSRLHIAAHDFARSRRFYEDTLGLQVYREFGVDGRVTGVVFFCGGGFVELGVGEPGTPPPDNLFLWLQVADVNAEHARLDAAGVVFDEPPARR